MIKTIRDIAISLFLIYTMCIMFWARVYPDQVGYWQAQKDIAYDSIWMEYVGDCDCTEALE